MTGLARRLTGVHAYSVALGSLLGVGVLYVPQRVENLGGPATPVAFLAALTGAVALSVGYAVFLSGPLGDRAGGGYLHLSRTWRSRGVGFLFVWPKPAAYASLLALLSTFLASRVPVDAPTDTVAVALLGLLAVAHLAGPRIVGNLGVFVTTAFVLFLFALLVPGLAAIVPGNFTPLFPTPPLREQPLLSMARATLVALFGFVGFEVVVALAGETRAARETIPRVLLGGVALAGVLAAAFAFVALGVIPWPRLTFARAPFVDAAAAALGVSPSVVLAPGVVGATLASLVALSWAPTRTLFALGELVPPLGHTNRYGAPDVAILSVFGVAAMLVLFDAVTLGLFFALPGLLLLYVAHALSAAALPWVNPPLYEAATVTISPRVLAVTGLVGAALGALLLWQSVTLDPAVTLGFTRVGPMLRGAAADPLVRDPMRSVVPALVAWETLGVLVYVAARDYRDTEGIELEPLTRF